MTEQEMMVLVPQKLREIEEAYGIKVLFAAESGSRSWRTAGRDSDFDVRFIYIRRPQEYLRLEPMRDVLEFPIEEGWDMSGWDMDKALRLLHKANPRIYEWFHSPIVYTDREFAGRFEPVMDQYFSEKNAVYHYLNMAKQVKAKFLQEDEVRVKKYLYGLHPLMAAQWILDRHTPPPVVYRELMEAVLPESLRPDVEALIERKVLHPEQKMMPRHPELDRYIQTQLETVTKRAMALPEEAEPRWEELNRFFLAELALVDKT